MLSYLNSQDINLSIWFHIICQKLSSAPLIMLILRVDKKKEKLLTLQLIGWYIIGKCKTHEKLNRKFSLVFI